MPSIKKSIKREIGVKLYRSFSSFDDILVANKLADARSIDQIIKESPELLGDFLFKWYQQGQIACVFAQHLSQDPNTAKWKSIVVQGNYSGDTLQSVLEQASEELNAVQIIFPGPGTANQSLDILTKLCSHEAWKCEIIDWLTDKVSGKYIEVGKSVPVGLRWRPSKKNYESWVLGIAPFEPMPFTRRFTGAPFIALVLRPSPPTPYAPTPINEKGISGSHLAHMDDGLGLHASRQRELFTEATRKAKFALLSSDLLSGARARVTFNLPPWCIDEVRNLIK